MPEYKAPLRDMQFVISEVLESGKLFQSLSGYEESTDELLMDILGEAARFVEGEVAPLYHSGDEEGCHLEDGVVTTPKGFPEAYAKYVEMGWPSLSADQRYGGQDLPNLLGIIMNEFTGSANWAWSMYPGLSHGAIRTLEEHASEEQKQQYLVPLISGQWTGTMCLTEAHCGTDLGLLRTKAEPQAGGGYKLDGTKIFISSGDHDLAENIVHIVLARLPDAPEGSKGISLFVVPKFMVNADGGVGQRNGVHCAALEKKMGIKASATCVLNFDGAVGYLLGQENEGLAAMFTFMNTARIGTATQGLSHAQLSYQGSLAYAKDRLQMRSVSGVKNPDGPADPIIVHPDVRRMLLTQKAFAEGGRAFIYYLGQLSDIVERGDEDRAGNANSQLAFLTPIAKAFLTETGFESANLGVQIFGGHGYIKDSGMEQIVRDARIAMLYEGTTGIQAMDLIGRKVLGSGGELLRVFTKVVHQFCGQINEREDMAEFHDALTGLNQEWGELTLKVGEAAIENPDEAGAAAVDYLMYSGYIVLAYFWARMAVVALDKKDVEKDGSFYEAKLFTARFYYQRILPRTTSLRETILSGSDNLMELEEADFAF